MTEIIGFRFPKSERITHPAEVKHLFREGKRFSCRGMRLVVSGNGRTYNRILCAPTRAFSNAVGRNRARRLAREIYRQHRNLLVTGHDIGVVMYPGDYTYHEREEQMMQLFRAAGILASGE